MCYCRPEIRTPRCNRSECVPRDAAKAETITIPRDLHDLYKEAAEKWARDVALRDHGAAAPECMSCDRNSEPGDMEVIHTADCKAARILGLKREATK